MDPSSDETAVVAEDGARLWVHVTGSGIPMVLCHGGPGLWDSLGSFAALVDDVATVHRWDQRGCGRSDRVGPYSVERMVADMDVIREHFGVDRWVVGGHSWGALLALHCVAADPDRALGLVYVSGFGLPDSWASANRGAYRAERARRLTPAQLDRLERLGALATRTPDDEREYRLLSWCTELSPGLDAERLLAEDLDAPWDINFDANRQLMLDAAEQAPRLRAALRNLSVPSLLIHGANDPIPVAGVVELAAHLPRADLVTLDTGHRPWLEAAPRVAELLRGFLRHSVG
jgi:proline iminopeptidase